MLIFTLYSLLFLQSLRLLNKLPTTRKNSWILVILIRSPTYITLKHHLWRRRRYHWHSDIIIFSFKILRWWAVPLNSILLSWTLIVRINIHQISIHWKLIPLLKTTNDSTTSMTLNIMQLSLTILSNTQLPICAQNLRTSSTRCEIRYIRW